MAEKLDDGGPPVGWTFEVSTQRTGDAPVDRLYDTPYHVGIADQALARAALEKHLTKLDGTEVKPRSPISASLARVLGLQPNEIKQE
jgi:hypothetical protein